MREGAARAKEAVPHVTVRPSILIAAFFALVFGILFGIITVARAEEPKMDAINERALQTLAITGQKVIQVDLGDSHSAAITSDGSLYTWGWNRYGQLGYATDTNASSTPKKVAGLPKVTDVSLGYSFSAAVADNGDLYTWGQNLYGQLGDGTNDDKSTPQKILGLPKVSDVSLGSTHGAAITVHGELYTWGHNLEGELGDGRQTDKNTPQKVQSLSDVKAISLGGNHSAAITANGDLYLWGDNHCGQLGDGTTVNKLKPQKLSSLPRIKAVSLGSAHSAVITADGGIYTWGNNYDGELGDGKQADRSTPQKVLDLPNAVSISLGYDHSAVITSDGSLYAWGANSYGEVSNSLVPTVKLEPEKSSSLSNVTAVAFGDSFSAAITSGGNLYTWGFDGSEQLGNGTGGTTYVPTLIFQGDDPIPAKQKSSVIPSPSSLPLTVGAESQRVVVRGEGDGELSATSSNDRVVTVEGYGTSDDGFPTVILKPVGEGTATVTITRAESDTYLPASATVSVTVEKGIKQSSTVTLTPSTLTLTAGDSPSKVTISGEGDGELSAKSSNPSVATAALSGSSLEVTPVGEGTATITVTRAETDGYLSASAALSVSVSQKASLPSGDKDITYGVDTFQFINSASHFFTGGRGTYQLSGDALDYLTHTLSGSAAKNAKDAMKKTWKGSCFGMASVLGLIKCGALDPSFFQASAKTTYELDYPKDSSAVSNLVNYYQVLQSVDDIATAKRAYDGKNETPNNKNLVETVQSSKSPVVFGINILEGSKRLGGHTLVAYGCAKSARGYEIDVWDPDNNTAKNTLVVSSDFTSSVFDKTYDTSTRESFVLYALPADGVLSSYKNLQQGLSSLGQTAKSASALALSSQSSQLVTNYDSFVISDAKGATATVVNGVKTEGSLTISDGDFLNEAGQAYEIAFSLPALSGDSSYTLEPTFDAESPMSAEGCKTALLDSDGSGFYSTIEAGSGGTFTIRADGSAASQLNTAATQTVSVTTDAKGENTWNTLSGEASAKSLRVDAPASGGASSTITTDTDATIKVSASNLYNDLALTAKGPSLTVLEPEVGQVKLTDSSGASQVSSLGHAVIFYTAGADPIDAQTNIAPGKTANKPQDPVRLGYRFCGWYTSPSYTTEFDFATPITQDTRLYAKWESADTSSDAIDMYRLYNQYTGEHLYTADPHEKDQMVSDGWSFESVMWRAPESSSTPIWRLYNPYSGDHHYARTQHEYDTLQDQGWRGEGIAFYSADSDGVPIYRLFNPYQTGIGTHTYTASAYERDQNVTQGWQYEQVGWYGLR